MLGCAMNDFQRNFCRGDLLATRGIRKAGTWCFRVSISLMAMMLMMVFSGCSDSDGGATPAAPTVPAADIETVSVQGTTPLCASVVDVANYGYEEQEYFASGSANRYRITAPLEDAEVIDGGWPYKTRIMVRKPVNPAHFNGTMVVEWYNVTTGQDIDFVWGGCYDYLMREGYIFVSVSAQLVGIRKLNEMNPDRYDSLSAEADNNDPLGGEIDPPMGVSVGGDVLGWDIFAQVASALSTHHGPDDPLQGLEVKHIIAAGESQSASRLTDYYNAIQPLHGLFDGFIYFDGAGIVREDSDVPAISVVSEMAHHYFDPDGSEHSGPDTTYLRRWPVAGSTHVSFQEMSAYVDELVLRDQYIIGPYGAMSISDVIVDCDNDPLPLWSLVPLELVLNSAIDHVNSWIQGGAPAPTAPRIERNADGTLKYDANGMVLGGIRLPQFEVPIAMNQATNGGPGFCFLTGSHDYYGDDELRALYGTHDHYVAEVERVTQAALDDGFILAEDASTIIAEAVASNVAQ